MKKSASSKNRDGRMGSIKIESGVVGDQGGVKIRKKGRLKGISFVKRGREMNLTNDDVVNLAMWLDTVCLNEKTKSYVMIVAALLTILDDEMIRAIKERDADALKRIFG